MQDIVSARMHARVCLLFTCEANVSVCLDCVYAGAQARPPFVRWGLNVRLCALTVEGS